MMIVVDVDDDMPLTYNVYRSGKVLCEITASLKANGVDVEGMTLDRGLCNAESLRFLPDEGISYIVMSKENVDAYKCLVAK